MTRPAWFRLCRMCGQASMVREQVRVGDLVIWVGECPDCDAGHCPRCLRHLGRTERWCVECGANVTLGTVAGAA